MKKLFYRNKRNPNKWLEVHNDGHYHNTVKQFMYWAETNIRNDLGDRCFHRWKAENLRELLNDYELTGVSI